MAWRSDPDLHARCTTKSGIGPNVVYERSVAQQQNTQRQLQFATAEDPIFRFESADVASKLWTPDGISISEVGSRALQV